MYVGAMRLSTSRCTVVSVTPMTDFDAPNSCWARTTPYPAGGTSSTFPKACVAESYVRADSRDVTAVSTPSDMPLARRPVTLAAPRIVAAGGQSTKSALVLQLGWAPMRRE